MSALTEIQCAKYFHHVRVRFCHLYFRFSPLLHVYPHCRLGIQSPSQGATSSRKRPRHSDEDGIQPTLVSRSSRLKRGMDRRLPFSVLSVVETSAKKSAASEPIPFLESLLAGVICLDIQSDEVCLIGYFVLSF